MRRGPTLPRIDTGTCQIRVWTDVARVPEWALCTGERALGVRGRSRDENALCAPGWPLSGHFLPWPQSQALKPMPLGRQL